VTADTPRRSEAAGDAARRPATAADPLLVLVQDEAALRAVATAPILRGLLVDATRPPTAEERTATVLLHGMAQFPETVKYIAQLPNLRLVQTMNAGFEWWIGHVPDGVSLSNARGAHGRAVAEWSVAMLLEHYRLLPYFAARQAERTWDRQVGRSLGGLRVAVIGAGDIGQHLRRMLLPFDAEVTLVDVRQGDSVISPDAFRDRQAEFDAISLAVPLMPATAKMVDAAFLARMKDGAVLVNGARGGLVDTDALMAACGSGRLTALLDVTDPEPLPSEHPLWTTPGVTITPHVAGVTEGMEDRARAVAVEQISMFARGETPSNVVLGPMAEGR
jgi:phosphoglycerate dehydrogenase-like enzyme